jgi:cystathionine beta-lyase/cystathionine gamma-synthase
VRLETLAIHAGHELDTTHGAVMQPIVLASTFAQTAPGEHRGYEYSRSGNPTRAALERALAALEGARYGFAFASGLGAATTLLSTLRAGDRVVSSDDVYGGSYRLLTKVFSAFGIESLFVDLTNAASLSAALTPSTTLLWIETPSNPLLKVVDIAALAAEARGRHVPVVVDNTFASPVFQNPLRLGATAVLHSTTKYINGHSDVVGGAIVTNDTALADRLRFLQNAMGAVPSPMDSYLVLRGIKTLPLRMRCHAESAEILAGRLERHACVQRVHYPGLPSHPQHALARRQMSGFGGMLSIELAGGLAEAKRFLSNLRLFTLAESLGGVESLAEHPALMTHASIPEAVRQALGIGDGLVRLSVGLEHVEDLWADLEDALKAAFAP